MSGEDELPNLAVPVHTTDPVVLWLVRLRLKARPRYLTILEAFLDYSGHRVDSLVEAARLDRHTMHETVKSFIASRLDSRAEREFAYSALRSFFTRCRVFLPTDPDYDVGGRSERWWLT